MTFLEKLKVNLGYLLGKADPLLYAEGYKSQNISSVDWRNRWDVFSDNGCGFCWYGVDSEKNLAKFVCDESYIPEAFFQDVTKNQELFNFFQNLAKVTNARLPNVLRPVFRELAERDRKNPILQLWNPLKEAQRGIYIFSEANDKTWYDENLHKQFSKNPYELLAIPEEPLKETSLPIEIQKLLEPYHFENLLFADCQFLDVSKYFYCEE